MALDYELRFQDPSSAETRFLHEEIIAQFLDHEVEAIQGIFAFASLGGLVAIIEDPAFEDYVARGDSLALLIGLDAITDRRALEFLQTAVNRHEPHLSIQVFKNKQPGLFHPKLIRVRRRDGSGLLLVGSGNMTPGGLRSNLEAYSILRFERGAQPDDSELDRFIHEHADEISEIDDEALARGDRNAERLAASRGVARRGRRRPRGEVRPEEATETAAVGEEELDTVDEVAPEADARVLLAQVPRASGRWHQIHFNREAIRDFFRARPHSPDRVLLQRVNSDGSVVGEPPRRVVLSVRNLNHKIEFGARGADPYPAGGPPIAVIRELGVRSFAYVMLFPGEPGYQEVTALLASRPPIGRGLPRAIVSRADLLTAWTGAPL